MMQIEKIIAIFKNAVAIEDLSFTTEQTEIIIKSLEFAEGNEARYKIVDFLNEVEEQDWELDADDIKHILNMDFDYIRKQYK